VHHVLLLVKGMLFGIANIIPGVSGGTFALILGIYERLIASLRAFGMETLRALGRLVRPPAGRGRAAILADEMRRTDAVFLLLLALGAAAAILASSRLITFLLDDHLAPTLAFFVGLIVPSILVPYRMLERRGWRELVSCAIAAAGLVCLTILPDPAQGSGAGLLSLFIAGIIAVSAMILPGVSGSFMLMLLGEYRTVLDAIKNWDIVRLGVFALGCLVGLALFVRLIHYLLARLHAVTMAFLMGLILGSLWVLWPFKQVAPGAKIITGTNILPAAFSGEVAWSLGALVVGLVCSAGLNLLGATREKPSPYTPTAAP